jgi:hypothetical protein
MSIRSALVRSRIPSIRFFIVFTAFFLTTNSCISPYTADSAFKPLYVIEGNITDQPGPYEVIVSMASPVWVPQVVSGTIGGASVSIADDHGNSEQLKEGSTGHYYTSTTQGQIGYTYTLTVKIGDNIVFQSQPEKLNPVGDFTLKYNFNLVNPNDQSPTSKNGFEVSLDSEVLPEQNGRVWWKAHGTYHIFTYAYLRLKPAPVGPGWVPDPPACSGYYVSVGGIKYSGPCTCCDCWVDQYNSTPLISDPRFTNGGVINDVSVFYINVNQRTFFDKYYLEVDQLNPSENVYNFWSLVKKQESNSSNLFQTPPPLARGNIFAVNTNSPDVIGYFSASAVKKHVITLDHLDVPYPILAIDSIPQSCLDYWRYSFANPHVSNVKPTFW